MCIGRLFWLLLLHPPLLSHAGHLYTFQSVDMESGEPLSKTEIRVQGDNLRIDHIDEYDEHDVVLFDGERVQHIDWQHRDYWVLEKSTVDHFNLHGTVQTFRDYIVAQARPEQRAAVAVTVGGGNVFAAMIPSTPVKLQITPRSDRTGQWGCHVYEGRTEAGDVVREYCVTHYERVEGSRELMARAPRSMSS